MGLRTRLEAAIPIVTGRPLALDNPAYGILVHELLRLTAASLESNGGFAAATRMQVESALAEAACQVGLDWELTKPLPPTLLWHRTLTEARETTFSALSWPLPKFKDQRTYVEVPFGGGLEGGEDNALWDRNALVAIPGSDLKLRGKIDRLDLDAKLTNARVIDYKTGRCPDEEPGLKNGEELQRCLYAAAVEALLAQVTAVEAALLYPGARGESVLALRPERRNQGTYTLPSTRRGDASVGPMCFRYGSGEPLQRPCFCLSRKRGGCVFFAKAAARDAMVRRFSGLWERTDAGAERRKNRRRALTTDSTLLVEAGAGTGKTSLLAGRVALLLASGYILATSQQLHSPN